MIFSVCAKIGQGAKALVFVGTSKSTVAMHSIADKLSIPVLMPLSTKYSQTHSEFTVSLQPSLNRPIIDVIQKNGWKQVFYLFDSDEGIWENTFIDCWWLQSKILPRYSLLCYYVFLVFCFFISGFDFLLLYFASILSFNILKNSKQYDFQIKIIKISDM